jgi:hypothetical protein
MKKPGAKKGHKIPDRLKSWSFTGHAKNPMYLDRPKVKKSKRQKEIC